MNLIRVIVTRPIAVAMAYLVVLVTGLVALSRLPLELTPDVDFPRLSVTAQWPDSSPEVVEAFVTAPIEAIANTVARVRKVDSISEEGRATVNIEFIRGTDMDFAALELNEKLSLIRETLPYGVQPPQIQKYVPKEFQTGQFLSFNLTGNFALPEIRNYAREHLRALLLAVQGVADVQVYGGQDPELQITLDPVKLRTLDLQPEQIQAALHQAQFRQTAGKIHRGNRTYDLRIDAPLHRIQDIAALRIPGKTGTTIRLQDLAEITLGYAAARSRFRINGNPAVVINIEKEVGTNTIQVADRIFARLRALEPNFPATLKLIKERDQSERIRTELKNLSTRALISILVIFFVLLLFLRTWYSPVIILSTIFLSLLLTFNLFYFARIGLNLLTLAGLALGFGMLVDNTIVVLDNIYRYRERGFQAIEAADRGTREIILPVVACTLTTVVAFIPFLYLTGELRIYYLPFALAVSLALLASLLVAFTFAPSLTRRFLARSHPKPAPQAASSGAEPIGGSQKNAYHRLLKYALGHKYSIIFLTLALFIGSYYIFNKYVTKGSIWSWGADTYLIVYINMPTGAELQRADDIAAKFESHIIKNPHIDKAYTHVYPEYARIEITFPLAIQFTATPLILKEELTQLAVQVGGPNVGVYGFGPGFSRGGGTAPSFRFNVFGYNYNQVKHIAEQVGQKLARNPRVREVNTNSSFFWWRDDLFEMVLRVDRDRLQQYHLTATQVLQAVQAHLRETLGWQQIKMAGREIDYRIKMRGYQDFDIKGLEQLLISTDSNEQVRLNQVAYLGERKVLARITRENQQYVRGISFEYRGPYKLGQRLVESTIANTQLPHGYRLEQPEWLAIQEEEKEQIYLVILLALLLVFMVTAGLFESFSQPFIVILTVPLALIGVFAIFYLTGTSFDRSAYIGVVLLAGIVVNNAIILVDHINRLRRQGLDRIEAVLRGASERLRPILMTSTTTILGLLPLLLFSQPETSIWYSLSLATIGGLISSTFLVLVVIPVLCAWRKG